MTKPPLDLTKRNADGTFQQVQTRDGRKARIICVDRKVPDYPVVALIDSNDGGEIASFTITGTYVQTVTHTLDLIPIPTRIKRDVWINVYRSGTDYCTHASRDLADRCASSQRLACIKVPIDCQEGEGL